MPPNFSAALIESKTPKEAKAIHDALNKQYRHLDADGVGELAKDSSAAVTAMAMDVDKPPVAEALNTVPCAFLTDHCMRGRESGLAALRDQPSGGATRTT